MKTKIAALFVVALAVAADHLDLQVVQRLQIRPAVADMSGEFRIALGERDVAAVEEALPRLVKDAEALRLHHVRP